jgi:hypothetical protein
MAPDGVAPRIKGSGIHPFLAWYSGAWGQDRLARAIGRLSPDDAIALGFTETDRFAILSSSWYPASAIHALLDALLTDHSADERAAIARDGGKAIIESTLRGVYRLLFATMMTPQRYARSAQALFERFYEPGTMTKEALGDHGHLTVVRDWPGHHPLLCSFLVHTAHYVYTELGCADVRVQRTACISDGAGDCRFEVLWSA